MGPLTTRSTTDRMSDMRRSSVLANGRDWTTLLALTAALRETGLWQIHVGRLRVRGATQDGVRWLR